MMTRASSVLCVRSLLRELATFFRSFMVTAPDGRNCPAAKHSGPNGTLKMPLQTTVLLIKSLISRPPHFRRFPDVSSLKAS